jgi:hypothetical protein
MATTLAVVLLACWLPYLGAAAGLFGFVPLPWPLMATALGVVIGYVACTEAAKTVRGVLAGTTAAR